MHAPILSLLTSGRRSSSSACSKELASLSYPGLILSSVLPWSIILLSDMVLCTAWHTTTDLSWSSKISVLNTLYRAVQINGARVFPSPKTKCQKVSLFGGGVLSTRWPWDATEGATMRPRLYLWTRASIYGCMIGTCAAARHHRCPRVPTREPCAPKIMDKTHAMIKRLPR